MNKYGYYEIDDFMISAPLIRTFKPQCMRAALKLEKDCRLSDNPLIAKQLSLLSKYIKIEQKNIYKN